MKYAIVFGILSFAALAQSPAGRCSIEGTVLNAITGEPLKKAGIRLERIAGAHTEQVAATDSSGHYRIGDLEPGVYSVMAFHTGFVNQWYRAKSANTIGAPLNLPAGSGQKDIDIRLDPQGAVSGRILDDDGEPLVYAQVELQSYVYNRGHKAIVTAGSASTNDLGEYRIFGVVPGRYFVHASYQIFTFGRGDSVDQGYSPVYYPNAATMDSAAPVKVAPGAQLRGMDFRLSKVPSIHVRGRVVDANGSAVKNAGISLESRNQLSAARSGGTMMQEDGAFEFNGVIPGSYVLTGNFVSGDAHLTGRITLEAGSTNLEGIVITVAPAPEVAGHLVIEGKTTLPFTGFNVSLQNKRSNEGSSAATVQTDGSFRLQYLMPETYDIDLYGLRQNFYLKSIQFAGADVTDAGLDFTEGVPPGELIITIKAAAGQVEGLVQDDQPKPVPGATVILIPAAPRRSLMRLYRFVPTDQNGHYLIDGIAPGEYKLFAWEQIAGDSYQDPDFLKQFESRGETITIHESAHEMKELQVIPVGEANPAQ